MSTKELIGAAEVARLLDMSRQGVVLAAAAGRIPAAGRIGKRQTYVFDRGAVEALAAERKEV